MAPENATDHSCATRSTPSPIAEWYNVTREVFETEIVPRFQPAVLRGAVRDWPAVQKGLESPQAVAKYVASFDSGGPVTSFFGPPEINGRIFYNEDLSGLNFQQVNASLKGTLGRILGTLQEAEPPAVYMGCSSVAESLPEFGRENRLDLVPESVVPNIWIGNKTTIAPHFDIPDNLACVLSGKRRFTLFPPEQVSNLYVGPIDFTPAGPAISLGDVSNPDFERFPRFREALAAAQVAELEPGDVLYIPSLWWHNVESLGEFNILLNYWWEKIPPSLGSPFDALMHSMMNIASLPPEKRDHWRSLFEHYVFRSEGDPAEHIPPERRGSLGEPTPGMVRQMRAYFRKLFGG